MSRACLLFVSLLAGCSHISDLKVVFKGDGDVIVNSESFALRSSEDGYRIRKHFPQAESISLVGLENCQMSEVWNLIDAHCKEGESKIDILSPINEYVLILRNGMRRPIKWFGRYSDPFHLNDYDQGKCIEIDCANFPREIPMVRDRNSFLHLKFEVRNTSGSVILDVIEKFDSAGGANSDVYLLPY